MDPFPCVGGPSHSLQSRCNNWDWCGKVWVWYKKRLRRQDGAVNSAGYLVIWTTSRSLTWRAINSARPGYNGSLLFTILTCSWKFFFLVTLKCQENYQHMMFQNYCYGAGWHVNFFYLFILLLLLLLFFLYNLRGLSEKSFFEYMWRTTELLTMTCGLQITLYITKSMLQPRPFPSNNQGQKSRFGVTSIRVPSHTFASVRYGVCWALFPCSRSIIRSFRRSCGTFSFGPEPLAAKIIFLRLLTWEIRFQRFPFLPRVYLAFFLVASCDDGVSPVYPMHAARLDRSFHAHHSFHLFDLQTPDRRKVLLGANLQTP